MNRGYELIINEKKLKKELIFSSLFVMAYENFLASWKKVVRDFYSKIQIIDGKLETGFFENINDPTDICGFRPVKSKTKEEEFKKAVYRRIPKKGNNWDYNLSLFDWMKSRGFIDKDDYDKLINIRGLRNKFAHELATVLFENFPVNARELFDELIRIRKKANRNWIREVEIPISADDTYFDENGEFQPPEYVENMQDIFFDVIISNAMKENEETNE